MEFQRFKKLLSSVASNKSGFTLTEVLVGVLVLSVSIVTTTNFLVSMIRSNLANTTSLQAYYYTQEGIEAFRNMRDTHFMHNVNYRGGGVGFWGALGGFETDGPYTVGLNLAPSPIASGENISGSASWKLSAGDVHENVKFYKTTGDISDTDFKRSCVVEDYEVDDVAEGNAVLVTCMTFWEEYGRDREVSLSTILTDWKHE
jgi:prepilin-type N-terminal cleavage/methylation domain-containing protein